MIKLEKFVLSDFKYLKNWLETEEELIQFAGPIFKFPLTKIQIKKYLEDNKRNVFRVLLNTGQGYQIIGMAELYNFSDSTNKIARVIIGKKSIRGKGIGTNLIKSLVKYSFEQDKKEYVSLNVYDWNIPAIQCYKKVGFTKTDSKPQITKIGRKQWKAIEMKISRTKVSSR